MVLVDQGRSCERPTPTILDMLYINALRASGDGVPSSCFRRPKTKTVVQVVQLTLLPKGRRDVNNCLRSSFNSTSAKRATKQEFAEAKEDRTSHH